MALSLGFGNSRPNSRAITAADVSNALIEKFPYLTVSSLRYGTKIRDASSGPDLIVDVRVRTKCEKGRAIAPPCASQVYRGAAMKELTIS